MTSKQLTIALLIFAGIISFLIYTNDYQDKKLQKVQEEFLSKGTASKIEPSREPEKESSILGTKDISQTKTEKDIPISSKSGIVLDANTGDLLYSKNHLQNRPIASLTKLMTALVYLEITNGELPDEKTTIYAEEYTIGGTLQMAYGEELSTQDLFHLMLVGSVNNATNALVRTTGLTNEEFAELMNNKAKEFELRNTRFYDPTGLDSQNTSTLNDIAHLSRIAFQNTTIHESSIQESYSFIFEHSGREKIIKNSNELIINHPEIEWRGSKTGYLDEAHWCVMTKIAYQDREFIVGVLAGPSKPSHFQDIITLNEAIKNGELQ